MVIITYITSINTPLRDISPKLPCVQEIQQGTGKRASNVFVTEPYHATSLKWAKRFKKTMVWLYNY